VVLNCTGTTSTVTGVLYGGVAMTLVTSATDTTEAGRVEVWVLADQASFPTGTQTVTLQGCTATAKWATCSTVTCSAGTRSKINASNFKNTTTATNPTLTVVTTATTILYGGMHGGAADPASYVVGTNHTSQFNNDYGALVARSSRRTAQVAAGSIVYNFTFATSDDYCIAAVALEEYTPFNSHPVSDASSPPIVKVTSANAVPSASFTPPDDCVLVVGFTSDQQDGDTAASTITDNTGGALTWTEHANRRENNPAGADEGKVALWTAPITTSPGAMTVTCDDASAGNVPKMLIVRVYLAADVDIADPIGGLVQGPFAASSTTIQASVTPETTGGGLRMLYLDWNATGIPTAFLPDNTDTALVDAYHNAGLSTNVQLTSSVETVASAAQTIGATLLSASSQGNYVAYELRAPSAGTPDVAGTPGGVTFTGVAGVIQSNLVATPAVVAFTGVTGTPRPNLAGTPASVVLTGSAGIPAPRVVGTPAGLTFTGVAGVPTPRVAATPGAVAFAGVAGAVQSNLAGTPGVVAFTGQAGAVRSNLVGTPGVATWTGVAGTISVPISVTGTPGVVNFTGVTGIALPQLVGTPGVLAFTGVAGAVRSNLVGTPAVIVFTGAAGSTAPTIPGVPGSVAFTGVAGIPRPTLVATPGVVTLTGQAGAVRSNLVGTPGSLGFAGVAGLRLVVCVPGGVVFTGVPGVVRPNLIATPGVVAFEAVAGTVVGAIPNVAGVPGVLVFTGVGGPILQRVTGTPGQFTLGGVAGLVRPVLLGAPGVLPFLGVSGGVRPNLVAIPGELAFIGVNGVFEPTKFYVLEARLLPGRYVVELDDGRYELIIPPGAADADLASQRYNVRAIDGRYDLEVFE
jgi:hypothetical protein